MTTRAEWSRMSPEEQDELIASGWHPGPMLRAEANCEVLADPPYVLLAVVEKDDSPHVERFLPIEEARALATELLACADALTEAGYV